MLLRTLAVTAISFTIGAVLLIGQGRAGSRTRTSWQKYGTYAAIVAIMLLVAYSSPIIYGVTILAIVAVSVGEIAGAAGMSVGESRSIAAICATITATAFLGIDTLYPTALGATMALFAIGAVAGAPDQGASRAVWGTVAVWLVAVPAAHLLPLGTADDRFGRFAFLFLVIAAGDAFGELIGRRWPRRRGFLTASPNKTLTGLLGGIAAAIAVAVAMGAALGTMPPHRAIAYGFALACAGAAGDLAVSSLKRKLGIKDFSNRLPGHGGVLDRFDSLLFAAPSYYWLLR